MPNQYLHLHSVLLMYCAYSALTGGLIVWLFRHRMDRSVAYVTDVEIGSGAPDPALRRGSARPIAKAPSSQK